MTDFMLKIAGKPLPALMEGATHDELLGWCVRALLGVPYR